MGKCNSDEKLSLEQDVTTGKVEILIPERFRELGAMESSRAEDNCLDHCIKRGVNDKLYRETMLDKSVGISKAKMLEYQKDILGFSSHQHAQEKCKFGHMVVKERLHILLKGLVKFQQLQEAL